MSSSQASASKAYREALKNARKAIKAKKAVSSSDLKTIKVYSSSVYNNLYAYNLALDSLETAKLEKAANDAATSAGKFENIAQKYENKDGKTNDRISLLQLKSGNATTAKSKNNKLDKTAAQYDKIVANDKAEIKEYNRQVKQDTKKITKSTSQVVGKGYSGLDSTKKKTVRSFIKKARQAAKKGAAIAANVISKLAQYYSKGYVSKAFYEACVNYNNALEHREEAEAQLEIDQQTAIQEKAATGTEKFSNVEQEYTNKQNVVSSGKSKEAVRQSIQTTKGHTLSVSDYQTMLGYSKQEQKIYTDEITALNKTIQENLSSGYWTAASQEYLDAMNSVSDYEEEALNCQKEQEELNNEIAQLPYTVFDKALSLIQSIKSNFQSLLSIKTTRGVSLTDSDILKEISNANDEIAKKTEERDKLWEDYQTALSNGGVYGGKDADTWLTEAQGRDLSESDYLAQVNDNDAKIAQYEKERSQAYSDYLKALADTDKVYGGMTSDEWLAKYYELGSTINGLKSDNEDIRDALRDDVYWRTFERAHNAAQALADVLSGISGLIDDDMLFGKDGKFTDFGVAQMANMVKQYENARKEVGNYTGDIQNLNKLYAQGYYNQDEFNEKLNELQEGLLDAASSMKSYISEIIDMDKNLAQSELDALFKLIDARNEALTAKKNYYDYDKTIKDKAKDIQALQAQVAALEGVDTAEAKAQKAKLEADLADAQDDLNDTLMEHSFELSQDALDELKTILQDEFDDRWGNIGQDLDEIQKLMSAANELTAAQSYTVGSALNRLLSFYGISPSDTDLDFFGHVTGYASGTRSVDKDKVAWTQENGKEIIIRKSDGAILTPLGKGDGVVPNAISNNLFEWGKFTPRQFMDGLTRNTVPDLPEIQNDLKQEFNFNYNGNMLNVEGSVDATVISNMKKFTNDFCKKSYEYTIQEIARDARKKGIKV